MSHDAHIGEREFSFVAEPEEELRDRQRLHIVRNRILNEMAADEFELLRPHLELVKFERGSVVQQVDAPIAFVHFLERGIVSLLVRTATDSPVELATVSSSGMLGIEVVVEPGRAIHRALVQAPGTTALRIKASDFHQIIQEHPPMRRHLARFFQLLLRESGQNLLCNTRHPLEQRLAKWLVLAHEQLDREAVRVTHDALAVALGVRRPSVTEVLAKFESDGLVHKSRGALRLPDPPSLATRACSCLSLMKGFGGHSKHDGRPHQLTLRA